MKAHNAIHIGNIKWRLFTWTHFFQSWRKRKNGTYQIIKEKTTNHIIMDFYMVNFYRRLTWGKSFFYRMRLSTVFVYMQLHAQLTVYIFFPAEHNGASQAAKLLCVFVSIWWKYWWFDCIEARISIINTNIYAFRMCFYLPAHFIRRCNF